MAPFPVLLPSAVVTWYASTSAPGLPTTILSPIVHKGGKLCCLLVSHNDDKDAAVKVETDDEVVATVLPPTCPCVVGGVILVLAVTSIVS